MDRVPSSTAWQRESLLADLERAIAQARELISTQQRAQAAERLLLGASLLRELAALTTDAQLRESRLEQADLLEARAAACRHQVSSTTKPNDAPPGRTLKPETAREDAKGQFRPYMGGGTVTFEDVAGLDELKEEIRVRMIEPFQFPEVAVRAGLDGGGNLLLYGPPGTGKTLIARAVAGEIDADFYSIKPSDLMSKWVGDAEKNVAQLFEQLYANDRAVLFLDEIEALMPKRQGNSSTVMARLVPEFLAQLDGFEKNDERCVMVIGATNEPWCLDRAVLRPGRFDVQVLVGLPDAKARRHLLEIALKRTPNNVEPKDYPSLVEVSDGMSGADFRGFSKTLAKFAFKRMKRDDDYVVSLEAIHEMLESTPRSVSRNDESRYTAYRRESANNRE